MASASFTDVTSVMGEFMLKGWVLTDKRCSTPGCSIPLMRSPRGQLPEVYFCAKCHGHLSAVNKPNDLPKQVSKSTSNETNTSSGSSLSRTSTPLTEVSNNENSDNEFELPPETEQSRRRREQSDRASTEIGSRLLKGWAMLGDECPNESCFGIPLVRPPSLGGEKSPQKECVVCGNVYLPEGKLANQGNIIPQNIPVPNLPIVRDEKLGLAPPSALPGLVQEQRGSSLSQNRPFEPANSFLSLSQSTTAYSSSSLLALNTTDEALQYTLRNLSARLTTLSDSNSFDAHALGSTADAISKVVQALSQVKAMQWNEAQAQNV